MMEPLFGRDKIAAIVDIQAVGVGPVLVNTAPRISPVVVHLTSQQVAAYAPHMLVLLTLFRYS